MTKREQRSFAGPLVAVLALGLAGLPSSGDEFELPSAPDEAPIRLRLVLVGDAGDSGFEELRPALTSFLAAEGEAGLAARTVVVYLGDNLYARGGVIVDESAAVGRLSEQISAGLATRGVFFVPGNHDWDDDGIAGVDVARGYTRLALEADYLARAAPRPERLQLLPAPGCPGPVVRDLGVARLVAFDSQWFLVDREARERLSEALGCPHPRTDAFLAALAGVLACSDASCPPAVVVAHHPLATRGPHGGYFRPLEHLLCLGGLPLPGLCSIYILLRRNGVSNQDVSSEIYERFIAQLTGVLRDAPPRVYAAGHDHSLQVLEVPYAGIHLVSGSAASRTPVRRGGGALYAASRTGVMALDFREEGDAELGVFVLDPAGSSLQRSFRRRIEAPGGGETARGGAPAGSR